MTARAPAWPGYTARLAPLAAAPKWTAVKAARLRADPCPDALDVLGWVRAHVAYTPDAAGRDVWQAPAATLARGKGDCEDLAILLRAILIARGWPVEDLVLLVAHDLELRCDHAVLWAGAGPEARIWDPLAPRPLSPAELAALARPKLAFGERACWVYEVAP